VEHGGSLQIAGEKAMMGRFPIDVSISEERLIALANNIELHKLSMSWFLSWLSGLASIDFALPSRTFRFFRHQKVFGAYFQTRPT
jgi:hypothetical protein